MDNLPTATVEPLKPTRWVWLIPLAAAIFAGSLAWDYFIKRGPLVTVRMVHGYGLKPGDMVRARGIVVGQVDSVKLTEDLGGAVVVLRLDPSARGLARSGTRFWVVRPALTLAGVSGLDTVAGPRYLAALPGGGEPSHRFDAIETPPVVETPEAGSLELQLTAERRGSLKPGTPLYFRQVPIGTVLDVGLSPDSSSVLVRAYIEPKYTTLIRDNSRFWNTSGLGFEAGLRGFRVDLESLQSLIEGGVSVATPDQPGEPVNPGHNFTLADRAEDAWLKWRPKIEIAQHQSSFRDPRETDVPPAENP